MTIRAVNPFEFYTDKLGKALEGGKIYFGVANLDPKTNPVGVFLDLAGTIPVAQPLRTVAGIPSLNGSARNFYVSGNNYSVRIEDKNGILISSSPTVAGGDVSVTDQWVGTATGTANDIVLTPNPGITAYTAGQKFTFVAMADNTGPVTVAVSGLGAIAVTTSGGAPLKANTIKSGGTYSVQHDGIDFSMSGTIGADLPLVVGLGAAPATDWLAGAAVQELGDRGAIYSRAIGTTIMAMNAKERATGFVRRVLGEASLVHMQENGSLQFYTAGSGAAGSAITWNLAIMSDPAGKITAGTVPLARLYAVDGGGYPQSGTGGETLRMIRGIVSDLGSKLHGNGFTSVKNSTGNYTVTFSTAFTGFPTVIVTDATGSGVKVFITAGLNGSSVIIKSYDLTGALADAAFGFIAVCTP